MKVFGFSALGLVVVFVVIGMFFTVIKPMNDAKEIPQRQDMVLGVDSHLDFNANGTN